MGCCARPPAARLRRCNCVDQHGLYSAPQEEPSRASSPHAAYLLAVVAKAVTLHRRRSTHIAHRYLHTGIIMASQKTIDIISPQIETSFATANEILLAPYSLDDTALQQIFGQIMTNKVDYADLYFQYSRSEGWSLEEGIVKSGSFSIDQGVGVRVLSGEKTAFAYSDDISLPALSSAAGSAHEPG